MIFEILTLSILLLLIFLLLFYTRLLSILYRGFANLDYEPTVQSPYISIIVSLHNEQKNVNQLIRCLTEQQYDRHKIEFILVNDRSTDNTLKILNEQAKNDSRNFRAVFKTYQPNI